MIHRVDRVTNIMTDYAGNPQGCNGKDVDGPLAEARLNGPVGLAFDGAGDLYIAEFNASRIREVAAGDASVITVAGMRSGACSTALDSVGDGCPANSAAVMLNGITDLVADAVGNVYVSDQDDQIVRKIAISSGPATGVITLYAGTPKTIGYGGDGGPATTATLHFPKGLVIDGSGNLYIADRGNNVVREVSGAGVITTVAGAYPGNDFSGDNGVATSARMRYPLGAVAGRRGRSLHLRVRKRYRSQGGPERNHFIPAGQRGPE